MTLSRLTELTRERWETGAHGDKHLRMSKALMDRLRAHWPPAPHKPWDPAPFDNIMSIPIVLDESVGEMCWELRESVSRRTVESGRVEELELAEGVDHG